MTRAARRSLPKLTAFRLALGIGLLVTGVHVLDGVLPRGRGLDLPLVADLEQAAQDWALTSLRDPRPPSGDVVIVAIDERSLEAEGRWPWSRAKLARLVSGLAEGGVRAAGFDLVWSEDDEAGRRLARVASLAREARGGVRDAEAARRLEEVWAAAAGPEPEPAAAIDPTERLADAIARARNVTVGFLLLGRWDAPDAAPGAASAAAAKLRSLRTEPIHGPAGGRLVGGPEGTIPGGYVGIVAPVDPIVAVAGSGGFVNVLPDRDGTIRRYRTVASAGGARFPALGVALLARAEGQGGAPAPVVPVAEAGAPEALRQVRVGGTAIDVDEGGRAGLAWHGRYRDFPAWSATDVLNGRIPRERMEGKIAVVGATAPGTGDQRVTPFDRSAPGVFVHATFVENALHGELLQRSGAVLAVEAALMLALSFGLAWVFARGSSLAAAPALVLAVGAWVGVAALALARAHVVLAVGVPVAQALAMFAAATTFRFVAEEREKRRARETFGRFLAPAIVEEVLSERGAVRLGGEKRVLTVLFGDLRGFTSIAERLDPHALLGLLNEILAPMTDVVVSGHEGTLDKYMGDAIMAFWGAPRGQPDHALRACRAALAMVDALAPLRERLRARGLPDVDVGIGINTGPMSVGFVGSEDRFYNYTVLGDAVNLASRLEGANKEYGTRILLGEATHALVDGAVVARELDRVRVKGKREPVRIFELLALAPAPAAIAAFLEPFARGLAAYQARRWDEADARFREADALRGGDPPSRAYLARCEAMRASPPGPEWDGVFEMRTK